ncbi:MAG: hypothetical protein QOF73_4719, partial [Thermomicrobiales bacterium]|nr:hypothetical protein [Thermomicrobiales bacterium]
STGATAVGAADLVAAAGNIPPILINRA